MFHLTLKENKTSFYRKKMIWFCLRWDRGSEIVETIGADLSSLLSEGTKIKISNEIYKIALVIPGNLILRAYYKTGTQENAVNGYVMDNCIGTGHLMNNGTLVMTT